MVEAVLEWEDQMSVEAPLSQRILDATEAVLRRHGAEKTNVVDVARALGMSHGNIYRHFPSKKALLDAVAVRWLEKVSKPLTAIALDKERTASDRLTAWFDTLRKAKRRKVRDDPELFQVYHNLVASRRDMVDEHVGEMRRQLAQIIADGMARGEFSNQLEPESAARAFLAATAAFHHPALVALEPLPTEAEARAVVELLLAGLRGGVS